MCAKASRFAGVWNHFARASLDAQVKLQLYATGEGGQISGEGKVSVDLRNKKTAIEVVVW